MAKLLFNEAEQYLLNSWSSASLLEQSMIAVRRKYSGLCDGVVAAVREKHPRLDAGGAYVTSTTDDGSIGIGRKIWGEPGSYPCGFYIGNLLLEAMLSSEEAKPPWAAIWIWPAKHIGIDRLVAKAKVLAAAPKVLATDEWSRCRRDDGDKNYIFWYDLPESREELLKMLLDGDGQKFAACLISYFDLLARFIPVLDEVLAVPGKAKG